MHKNMSCQKKSENNCEYDHPDCEYDHPDDQTQSTFEMTPGFKPFTVLWYIMLCNGIEKAINMWKCSSKPT